MKSLCTRVECEGCKEKGEVVQRRAVRDPANNLSVAPIVHEVLRSPGQPLDASTRSFMEPRFGHDFGRVRVHLDSRAAKAQELRKLYY